MSQCQKCGVELEFLTPLKRVEHDRECGTLADVGMERDNSNSYTKSRGSFGQ